MRCRVGSDLVVIRHRGPVDLVPRLWLARAIVLLGIGFLAGALITAARLGGL